MTGAPKMRTMDIIDSIEEQVPRGPYSGSIGYIGLNGALDMNICIRTAVVTPDKVSIGCGGAITYLSDVNAEYDEMVLKGSVVKRSVSRGYARQLHARGIASKETRAN